MQSKYAALESKSKEIILQQNNTVSGATLALSDLGQRLNSLVEQLISSYNISEQDLEVKNDFYFIIIVNNVTDMFIFRITGSSLS